MSSLKIRFWSLMHCQFTKGDVNTFLSPQLFTVMSSCHHRHGSTESGTVLLRDPSMPAAPGRPDGVWKQGIQGPQWDPTAASLFPVSAGWTSGGLQMWTHTRLAKVTGSEELAPTRTRASRLPSPGSAKPASPHSPGRSLLLPSKGRNSRGF